MPDSSTTRVAGLDSLNSAGASGADVVRRAAVLGTPIRHSLSPVLHGAAYAALGLPGWRYDVFECDEAGLPAFVDALGDEWAGLSLTMPLKRVAMTVAKEVSPLAAAVGAANTLTLNGGRRVADNTDVAGLVEAIREAGVQRIDRAVIIGAGGTAQSAIAALREFDETSATVVVRDLARTTDLRATADRLGLNPTLRGGLGSRPLPDGDVIISTLPFGAADALAPAHWSRDTLVLDTVYAPWPTKFAAAAEQAGCRVVSGLAMLLHQAVAQVQLMTGRPGPVDAMRTALDDAVQNPLAQ